MSEALGFTGPVQEMAGGLRVELRETADGWYWRAVYDDMMVVASGGEVGFGFSKAEAEALAYWYLTHWLVEQRARLDEDGWVTP